MDVLLDVLLSLLARPAAPLPSAPLREAVNGVWRVCCDELSGNGVADLVRVIAAGKGEEGERSEGPDGRQWSCCAEVRSGPGHLVNGPVFDTANQHRRLSYSKQLCCDGVWGGGAAKMN